MNNWEQITNLILCFHTQLEVFFKINFITGWSSTCFISEWKSRINRNYFIPERVLSGMSFISVTCKQTLNIKNKLPILNCYLNRTFCQYWVINNSCLYQSYWYFISNSVVAWWTFFTGRGIFIDIFTAKSFKLLSSH